MLFFLIANPLKAFTLYITTHFSFAHVMHLREMLVKKVSSIPSSWCVQDYVRSPTLSVRGELP